MPPRFSLLPPRFISCTPTVFFWEEEVVFFLAGKNVEICDLRQKKPSDFSEDLLFFFVFFGDHLVLAGKFAISARKSLRTSAKTFFFWRSPAFGRKETLKFRPEKAFGNRQKPLPPPDFNSPPRSRKAGDAPGRITSFNIKGPEESNKLTYAEKNLQRSR